MLAMPSQDSARLSHFPGKRIKKLFSLCTVTDISNILAPPSACLGVFCFSAISAETVCSYGVSVLFPTLCHHPTAILLGFFPVMLLEQMCQHLVTDGCLQQGTKFLNISYQHQERLHSHLKTG